jgi:hypothetical protein
MKVDSIQEREADPKRLPKMKAKYKKKWLAALRDGEYEQTAGRLADDDGYCCLGVLCDVVAQDHPEMDDYIDHNSGAPPEELWELVLTNESLKTIRKEGIVLGDEKDWRQRVTLSIIPLIVRNDGTSTSKFAGKQQSFKRIANIIERHM